MIVVSDTSPITNLIQIGQLNLLKELYTEVLIPTYVYEELIYLDAQKDILTDVNWIFVKDVRDRRKFEELCLRVDKGEAAAMVLALECGADYLLIDEQIGRLIAEECGLKIVGVLGILVEAKSKGLISEVRLYMTQLRDIASFRIHPKLFDKILQLVGENE